MKEQIGELKASRGIEQSRENRQQQKRLRIINTYLNKEGDHMKLRKKKEWEMQEKKKN